MTAEISVTVSIVRYLIDIGLWIFEQLLLVLERFDRMPDITTEQQAMFTASSELVTAFSTLADDHERMKQADTSYEAIATKRAETAQLFVMANADFLAAPQDSDALRRLIDVGTLLLADSTQMRSLKTAKDDADLTETVAAKSYDTVRSDFEAKVKTFLDTNTVQL